MDPSLYKQLQETEEKHWWCRGRREIILSLVDSVVTGTDLKILEIGCGTGRNLKHLETFGDVIGAESSPIAIEYARQNTGLKIAKCELPYDVPFEDSSFDMVVMLDVLEHIEEDVEALRKVRKLLRPGGILICAVPAHNFLWSVHDDLHHHKRRYTLPELRNKLSSSGYQINKITYYNFFLFPPIALARVINKIMKFSQFVGLSMPNVVINELLFNVFRLEAWILKFSVLPVGVSIVALSRKAYPDPSS